MAITRETWTDDSGTGTDGTVLNNAALQSVYDSIEDTYGETGSWTPVIGGTTSETGQSYGVQFGRYSKVDNTVFFWGRAQLSTKGTITGSVVIKGLPYAAPNVTNQFGGFTVNWFANLTTAVVDVRGFVQTATSYAVLYINTAAATGLTAMATGDLSNTSDLVFSGFYRVT